MHLHIRGLLFSAAVVAVGLTSCETMSTHQFAAPAANWQSRSGQLAYRGPKMSLIGEVLVRYSSSADFELTFTKGPGVPLLTLREDATFGDVSGPLARGHWSGPIANAPARLRGWLALRDDVLAARGKSSITHSAAGETFNLRF